MPELPEVESVRLVLEPELRGQTLLTLAFRRGDLRWPMPLRELRAGRGHRLERIERRGKYLVFVFDRGAPFSWIAHLGMSGKMLLDDALRPRWRVHEHYRLRFGPLLVRYVDPRRFGALLVAPRGREGEHPLLARMGPDPFDTTDGRDLHARARGLEQNVKSYLLDGSKIAGVGNIYANEALFVAGIDPRSPARRLQVAQWQELLDALRLVMRRALERGGTTLRDHVDARGRSGWFQLELQVYGRGGAPCTRCGKRLQEIRISGRSTVFCPSCQQAAH